MSERDIVDRLRHSAAVNRSGGWDGDAEEREEAAEIVQLRQTCRELQDALNQARAPQGHRAQRVAEWLREKGYKVEAPR